MIIIFFIRIYVGQHFPEKLVFRLFSLSLFLVLNRTMFLIKTFTYVLSLFEKVLCNLLVFVKTQQTIYKNYFM